MYCGTNQTLKLKLSGAKATADCPWSALAIATDNTPTPSNGVTNGTSDVTVIAATKGLLKWLILRNADSAAIAFNLIYDDNGDQRIVAITTLAAGDTLELNSSSGFRVINANGRLKSSECMATGDLTGGTETLGESASHGSSVLAARADHRHAIGTPKLDDLDTPDDNTDLDATTGRHGLLSKPPALIDAAVSIRGDGSWGTGDGVLPCCDDSSIDAAGVAWGKMATMLNESASSGQVFSKGIVSTYSLVYTMSNGAFAGGVLARNGDIHFIPAASTIGQKISSLGAVSTYSLAYTADAINGAYCGGVLAPNGEIHFIPGYASRGQKISTLGVVSTYALAYTAADTSYSGGVLAPNGDIHFVPYSAPVGQKISSAGVVSTYALVYTKSSAYSGGVLALNGDIHFVPVFSGIGQKVSSAGVVSTYALAYTVSNAYNGGILAPNGDIHFVPFSAAVGQKVSSAGVVSTYSLAYTTPTGFLGGFIDASGAIHFVPSWAAVGQKITTLPAKPFNEGVRLSSFFNRY